MLSPSPPGLENILSSPAITHKRTAEARAVAQAKERTAEARAAARAKERAALLSQYPVCRRRRESETWLLPQLIYHWALTVNENRAVEWAAGRGFYSGQTGYSVTTTSQNYDSLEQDGLLHREQPAPKGWNGWQPCILRPGPALMPAILQKARKIRAERKRAKAYATKKHRLSLTSDRNENSEVSDNLENRRPLREDSSPLGEPGKKAFAAMSQIPRRHPPPEPPG